MILGLLSDTHGIKRRTAAALRLLEHKGAEAFVHCGDVGREPIFDELAGRRAWFVWGNTDTLGFGLEQYAAALGLPLPDGVPLRIELSDRVLAVFHGHEPQAERLQRLLLDDNVAAFEAALPGCDYVLFGHTHVPADLRVGRLRLINPGALCRANPPTVATLDLEHDELTFWPVSDERV